MSTMASQITSLTIVYSTDYQFIQAQITENIKAPRHWPLWGNSPVTGELPAQRASNAQNVSIWWRHHDSVMFDTGKSAPHLSRLGWYLDTRCSGVECRHIIFLTNITINECCISAWQWWDVYAHVHSFWTTDLGFLTLDIIVSEISHPRDVSAAGL